MSSLCDSSLHFCLKEKSIQNHGKDINEKRWKEIKVEKELLEI